MGIDCFRIRATTIGSGSMYDRMRRSRSTLTLRGEVPKDRREEEEKGKLERDD